MNETKVNAFIASVAPPRGKDALSSYIEAVVRALGGRNDSALARTMGVAPSTLASWKSRGAIPEEWAPWFTTALVEKVAAYRRDLAPASLAATAAVVELLMRTDGDPLAMGDDSRATTARMLGPFFVIADFVIAVRGVDRSDTSRNTTAQTAEILEGAAIYLRGEVL